MPEPLPVPRPTVSVRRRWAATVTACLGLFLLGLDLTVLNVAVPELRDDLNASMRQTEWIVDAYSLVLGGTVLSVGAVTDRLGRRRAFVGGLCGCGVASVFGALAGAPGQVIAARAGMGAGAALLMPATLSIITGLFPEPGPRARAIALWAAVGGLGGACGPLTGGWLVTHFSWRAAFWVNVPCALTAVVLALWLVPATRRARGGRLDLPGAALSAAGLLALVWGIIESPSRGWTSPLVLAVFSLAALLLAAFAERERRARAPMLPLELLGHPRVSVAAGALALMSFALFGALFVVTLYLQGVLGYSPWQAGIRTLPLPGALSAGALLATWPAPRRGEKTTLLLGLGVVVAGFVILAGTRTGSGYGRLAAFQAVAGLGAGLMAPTATAAVLDAVPLSRPGLGSAINDATRQVGSTLGVAVQGSVLAAAYTGRMNDALARAHAPAALSPAADNVLAANTAASHLPPAASQLLLHSAENAFVTGLTRTAVVAGLVTLAAAAVTWRWLPAPGRATAAGEPIASP
ncbi:MFS transporter [Streptomyces orinoci]|uniref:MFS transporter n=1 Tax=Streptomyces orinoci TaxID=67339 RepID=A0ABV3JYY7_STRON|nr:MFS transporter [Streptomyces orinoci]